MAVAAPPQHEQPVEADANAVPVDEAREYAIASVRRKRKFAHDLVAYVAVNGLLWLIWLITGHSTGGSIPWPAWVSIFWGFFLALDGWRAYGGWSASLNAPISESEIERELERTRSR
jgi:2TM domain